MIDIKCTQCGKTVQRKQRGNKFCSRDCYWSAKQGTTHSHGAKISLALRGVPKSAVHIQHVREALRGKVRADIESEKHHHWKGDKCGYSSIHDWVRRRLNKPSVCQECGVPDRQITQSTGVAISYLHLANISGEYKRTIEDWKYLCPKCHSRMDKGRDSIRVIFKTKSRTR